MSLSGRRLTLFDLAGGGGRAGRETGRGVEESAAAAIRQSGPTRAAMFGRGTHAAGSEAMLSGITGPKGREYMEIEISGNLIM